MPRSVHRVIVPGGLFYWGQYGGMEFEGVYAERVFEIVDFRTIPRKPGWWYQALILRVRSETGQLKPSPSPWQTA